MNITELTTQRVREEWEAPLKTRIIALETELAFAVSGYEDRIEALEAVLRCCLADPRIPTDLWRVIESALAAAETGVKP